VAWTEHAGAARAGDLDRARDRDDELALLRRVVLLGAAERVLAEYQPGHRQGRAAARDALALQHLLHRELVVLEVRAPVRARVDANDLDGPHRVRSSDRFRPSTQVPAQEEITLGRA